MKAMDVWNYKVEKEKDDFNYNAAMYVFFAFFVLIGIRLLTRKYAKSSQEFVPMRAKRVREKLM